MKIIKMKIIKENEIGNKPIVQPDPHLDSVVKGQGNVNYVCGNCKKVLLEKINEGQITEIVFRCPVCGELNLP